ncbi:MAG TPA: hypothetical protein VG737_11790 [Cyclobacteriaceae bacterium]|nr:hypothetical protein [Cyclobacteriaceae bacterium]
MRRNYFAIVFLIVAAVTSCKKEEIAQKQVLALDYYTETFSASSPGIQPTTKVQYEYNAAGKVSRYTVSALNTTISTFEPQRYVAFTYLNNRVDKVEGFLPGSTTPYFQDFYQYLPDGRVSKIAENNFAAALTSEANFQYSAADETIKVAYTYSNGGAFEYEFNGRDHNIQTDKTTRGPELCSTGSYTYDNKVNPFSAMGYVDYQLLNFSSNNKLTESINYVSCSFPALIADTFSYEYNEQGYPTVLVTTYKGSQLKSERRFYYKSGM